MVDKKDVGIILGVIVVAGIFYFAGRQQGLLQVRQEEPTVDYDGTFDTLQEPQEVSGSDLNITSFSINESDKPIPDTNVNIPFYANASSDTVLMGSGIEIGGPMKGVNFEVSLEDAGANWTLSKAYLLKDEEGTTLDIDDAEEKFTVEDEDEVDAKVSSLDSGEYIFVVEGRLLGNGAKSKDMIKVVMDADEAGDEDYVKYYIDQLN